MSLSNRIGSSRIRTPVAWCTALATAAAAPTMPISPMPFTPAGFSSSSRSSSQYASMDSDVRAAGDVVGGQVVVDPVAVPLVEQALLVQRHRQPHRHAADELDCAPSSGSPPARPRTPRASGSAVPRRCPRRPAPRRTAPRTRDRGSAGCPPTSSAVSASAVTSPVGGPPSRSFSRSACAAPDHRPAPTGGAHRAPGHRRGRQAAVADRGSPPAPAAPRARRRPPARSPSGRRCRCRWR